MHYSFEIKIVMIAELEMRLDSQIFTHFALPNKKESIKSKETLTKLLDPRRIRRRDKLVLAKIRS